MPKENIQRAIAKGVGAASGVGFDEVTYEGYGPGGAAVIAECNTDNRNRMAADIRHAFTHHGGSLGATGCVAWMFKKKGSIIVDKEAADEDTIMMIALDAGAEDVAVGEDSYEITTSPEDFMTVSDAQASPFPLPKWAWCRIPPYPSPATRRKRCSISSTSWKIWTTCRKSTRTPICLTRNKTGEHRETGVFLRPFSDARKFFRR